ncbi:hypothetical protein [Aureivirga sp. CE67]|uniref:hypothetical protein n=1 Tax=Aureivirga sp. CE67 TaxID=1788983 RepID=UPI0018CB8717|nr:hypothetical protein [Aureivirga sp. CE67]
MRLFKLFVFSFLISFVGIQCKSQKVDSTPKLTTEIPFKIDKATIQKWVGGRPNAGGTNVKLYLSDVKDVEFKEIYFRGKKTALKAFNNDKNRSGTNLVAAFNKERKKDINLSGNSKEEYGNKAKEMIPFELTAKQAVISYKEDGKLKYYKINSMRELEPIYYP